MSFLLLMVFPFSEELSAQFTQQTKLVGSGSVSRPIVPFDIPVPVGQGSSVGLSADGNTAVLNGPGDDNGTGVAVWAFTRANGVWNQQGDKLIGKGATADPFVGQGASVAISADGNTLVFDGRGDNRGNGAGWVFTRTNEAWTQQGDKLVGEGSAFPLYQCCTAISGDSNTAVFFDIPSTRDTNGFSWIFSRAKGNWSQQGGMLIGSNVGGSERVVTRFFANGTQRLSLFSTAQTSDKIAYKCESPISY